MVNQFTLHHINQINIGQKRGRLEITVSSKFRNETKVRTIFRVALTPSTPSESMLKLCSERAKANARKKNFFDVFRLFFDLFCLFFDIFCLCSRFFLVSIGFHTKPSLLYYIIDFRYQISIDNVDHNLDDFNDNDEGDSRPQIESAP